MRWISPVNMGPNILFLPTSECYGDPLEHPQKETYWGHVNPIGPRSVYDEAKRFTEAVTMAYHRYYKVDTRIARIFNTYGPRMQLNDGRVIPNFMTQALRGRRPHRVRRGGQTRSFCYVTDEIDGFIRLSRSSEHLPVNIGNPDEFTILECARQVIAVTGSKSRIRNEALPPDDPKQRQPDISKAKTLLGWEPKIGLREGLQLSLDYFRSTLEKKTAQPARKTYSCSICSMGSTVICDCDACASRSFFTCALSSAPFSVNSTPMP